MHKNKALQNRHDKPSFGIVIKHCLWWRYADDPYRLVLCHLQSKLSTT